MDDFKTYLIYFIDGGSVSINAVYCAYRDDGFIFHVTEGGGGDMYISVDKVAAVVPADIMPETALTKLRLQEWAEQSKN